MNGKQAVMGSKKKAVTFFLDGLLYEQFRTYCDKNGLVASKRFERFMENELATPDFSSLDLKIKKRIQGLLK